MRIGVAVLLAVAAIGLGRGPAAGRAWADPGEAVTAFDAAVAVDPGGDLRVTETIAYRFAGTGHHGLLRELSTHATAGGRERAVAVTAVSVESPTGAPTQTAVSTADPYTTIRVGDPTRTVSGEQTYVLHYTVGGMFDELSSPRPEDVLAWDVTGTGWTVPIERASVHIPGPRAATEQHCASPGCAITSSGATATFTAGPLAPGDGMFVTLDYPAGTAPAPAAAPVPADDATPTLGGRLLGWGMLLVVLGGLGGGAWVVARMLQEPMEGAPRHGRPLGVRAVPAAGPVPVSDDPAPDDPDLLPLAEAGLPAPPPDLSPGLLGTLHSEGTSPDSVTATLMDLAARGHLRIQELNESYWGADWSLVIARPGPDDQLLPLEDALLTAVSRSPTVSALCRDQTHALRRVQRALVAAGVARGWLAENRLATGGRIAGQTVLCCGVAIGLVTFAVHPFPYFFFSVLTSMVGGVAAKHFADYRPARRTAAGDTILAELAPYRAQLAGAGLDGIPPSRAAEVFGRSLPYAVAIGCTHAWTSRFAELYSDATSTRWYATARPVTEFDAVTRSLTAFVTAAARRPARARRSGGFSGSSSSSSSSEFSSSSFDSGSSSSSSSGGGSSW